MANIFRTRAVHCRPAFFTNATDASFTNPQITLTEPAGDGIISFRNGHMPNSLLLQPYGVGSAGSSFVMRVWGHHVAGYDSTGSTAQDTGLVLGATNATPIVIFSPNHGLVTGTLITITGVLGNTAANVTNNPITVIDENSFSLDAVAANGLYASGGVWTVAKPIWVPMPLIEVTCTLCTQVGVATGLVDNTQRMCDTIVQTAAWGSTPGLSNEIISPTGNITGHIVLDLKGSTKAQFQFNISGVTSANCLVGEI
jgi:hypothetical protein